MPSIVAAVAQEMVRYFGNDARRVNHALKVHSFARIIAVSEDFPAHKLTVLEIAALLHDIGIKEAERQYQSTAGHYQEMLGPAIGRDLLKDLNLPEDTVDRVAFLIGHHHSYGEIDGTDFQILVEADFLVNIFEDQMDRDQIAAIRQKYFKTGTGSELLSHMYL